jgi:hypothetical protein
VLRSMCYRLQGTLKRNDEQDQGSSKPQSRASASNSCARTGGQAALDFAVRRSLSASVPQTPSGVCASSNGYRVVPLIGRWDPK